MSLSPKAQQIVDAVRLLADMKTPTRDEFWQEAFADVNETNYRIRSHREKHLEMACYHCWEACRDFIVEKPPTPQSNHP